MLQTSPPLALIVAQAANRVIGRDNQLPWHLPEDLRHFKRVTLGKPIIMGRKTYESIGRPLPGRHNIVLSRQSDWCAQGVSCCASLDGALALAAAEEPAEILVIGGEGIYRLALPRAVKIYLTQVHREYSGDAFFPSLEGDAWEETNRSDGFDAASQTRYSFVTLERKC